MEFEEPEAFARAVKDVRSDMSFADWCLLGYKNETVLRMVGNGKGGLQCLLDAAEPYGVNYGLLRVRTCHETKGQRRGGGKGPCVCHGGGWRRTPMLCMPSLAVRPLTTRLREDRAFFFSTRSSRATHGDGLPWERFYRENEREGETSWPWAFARAGCLCLKPG